jgi:hypothetical protein
MLCSEPALYVVRASEPATPRIEARRAGHQRVLFVHGVRTHVLGAISEHAVVELHALPDLHAVLCVDRGGGPRISTVKIRVWASRDGGAHWTVDPSLDVGSLGAATRLMREDALR